MKWLTMQTDTLPIKTAVELKNVGMCYNLNRERTDNLKEDVSRFMRQLMRKKERAKAKPNEFWGVRNINLKLEKGDRLGVLGLNGAGKSTLLKIIAGVLRPTEGTVSVNGVVAPLLELGAGFDRSYSGGENIYLYGATLGFSRQQIKEVWQEIVDFSELQDFIDVPVKNYSSGMRSRLGFSIACMVKPDVLILDEVLAVGDSAFRKKSLQKMMEMFDSGVTVIYVSHSAPQVKKLCNRAILLEKGQIIAEGETQDVCAEYVARMGDVKKKKKKRKALKCKNCGAVIK